MTAYRLSLVGWGAALAVLACAACRAVPHITGSYELRAVNRQPLPFRGGPVAGTSSEVTGGSITLNPDGTFQRRLRFNVYSGKSVHPDSSLQSGTYELRMSTVVLHVPGGDESADLAGQALTMNVRGWTYLFRKPAP